jgi:IMP dehydrogenase
LRELGVGRVDVDTRTGHSRGCHRDGAKIKAALVRRSRSIAGYIVTDRMLRLALVDAGCRTPGQVGHRPGLDCTTRVGRGPSGCRQIRRLAPTVAGDAREQAGVPADRVRRHPFSGDIARRCRRANCVMIGGFFAGTEDSPGEVELYQGRSYKSYRGMGSLGAMAQSHGSRDRYFQDASAELEKLVPEGVEGARARTRAAS